MDKRKELEMFQQLAANNPRLKDWVSEELEASRDSLTKQRDLIALHQAQGKAQLLERMLTLMSSTIVIRGV